MLKKTHSSNYYGWLVCSLAAIFYCYEYLLRIQPSVMVQPLLHYFNVTAGGLSLLVAMYYYAYTPMQLLVGIITDAYGARRVLISAVALCAIGSYGFQESTNIYLAAASRFMVGAGSAFAFVGVLKLASIWLPPKRFAFFVGATTALAMVAGMTGDIFMAWLVEKYSWQHVIVLSAFGGIVLIVIFFIFLRENGHEKTADIDITLKNLFKQAFRMLGNSQILYAGIIGCLLYLSLSVFAEMWGIPFIYKIQHTTNIFAAEINSAVFFGWLVGSPFNGWLSDQIGSRKLLIIFGGWIAALSLLVIIIWPQMNVMLLGTLLFLFGFASSAEILCFAIGRDNVSKEYLATAMAVINLLIMLGGVILQPVVGWLLNFFWNGQSFHDVRIYDALAYRQALLIIPIMMLIASLLAFRLKD